MKYLLFLFPIFLQAQCLIPTHSYRLICADEVRYADSISSGSRLYISSKNAFVTSPRSVFSLVNGYGQHFIQITNSANSQKVAINRAWINRIDSTSGNKALIYIKDISVTFTTTESYTAVKDSAIACFIRSVASGLATLSDGDYGDVVVSGGGLVMTVDKPDLGLHNLADGDFSVVADSTALSLTGTRSITLQTQNIDGWISRYLQTNNSLTLRTNNTTKTSRIFVDTTGANFQFVNGANNASLRIGDSVAVRFNTSGSVGQVLTVTSIDGDGRLVINPKTGGSGTANCEQTLTKTSHGFSKWTPIYWNGSAWARPTFDSIIPTYIVVDSTTVNTFKVSNCGNYSSTLTAGLYYYKGASPGYSLTPTSIPTPLFEVAQARLILQPLVGFQLASGSGGVSSMVLADTAAAIRADFPSTKRDTFITVPPNTTYFPNIIDNPARFYNNIYLSCKGRTDTSIVAFLASPVFEEQKGVVYNIKNDSGLVAAFVLNYSHFSNSKSFYMLKRGQTAQVRLLPDAANPGQYGWAVNVVWDSTDVGDRITASSGANYTRVVASPTTLNVQSNLGSYNLPRAYNGAGEKILAWKDSVGGFYPKLGFGDGVNWVSRSAAEANSWNSVAYGNGLFVAVAATGTNRVMTSPDGVNWTARSAAEANGWNSATYGNGLFVAVSPNGTHRVMTSPDGVNWTARSAAEVNLWRTVTYGNGLFVVVSTNGTNRVMTSPDGVNWTARSAAEANLWNSVAYGNGLFVAVAATGTNKVMTSPDGVNWTARSAAEETFWRTVTYGNGLFVSLSNGGTNRVMTSGRSTQNVTPAPYVPIYRNSVASGTTDGSGDLIVAFASAMPDATYTVVSQNEGITAYILSAHTKATGSMKIRVFDAAGAAVTSTSVTISYEVKDY